MIIAEMLKFQHFSYYHSNLFKCKFDNQICIIQQIRAKKHANTVALFFVNCYNVNDVTIEYNPILVQPSPVTWHGGKNDRVYMETYRPPAFWKG